MRAPDFHRDEPIPAADLNRLSRGLEALSRMSVIGGRMTEVGGRIAIAMNRPRGSRGGGREYWPWQPVSTAAFSFRLRKGPVLAFGVQHLTPSNANAVFNCPANNSTGFWVWLAATGITDGNIGSLAYDSGTTLPGGAAGDPDTGALPTSSYCPIAYATSTDDGIDFVYSLARGVVTIDVNLESRTCSAEKRSIKWGGFLEASAA